jgi:hypothetical protein
MQKRKQVLETPGAVSPEVAVRQRRGSRRINRL